MGKAALHNNIQGQSIFPNFLKGLQRIISLCPDINGIPDYKKCEKLSEICEINEETIRNWFKKSGYRESNSNEKSYYTPHWNTVYKLIKGLTWYYESDPDHMHPLVARGEISLGLLFNQDYFYYENHDEWVNLCYKLNLSTEAIDTIICMTDVQRDFFELLFSQPDLFPVLLKRLSEYSTLRTYILQELDDIRNYSREAPTVKIKQTITLLTELSDQRQQILHFTDRVLNEFLDSFPRNIDVRDFGYRDYSYADPYGFNYAAGLARLMSKECITVSQLSKEIKIPAPTIRSWLLFNPNDAKIPSVATIEKICSKYEIDIDYLFHISNWTQRENWCIAHALNFRHEKIILWLKNLDDTSSYAINILLENHFDIFRSLTDKLSILNVARFFQNYIQASQACDSHDSIREIFNIFFGSDEMIPVFAGYITRFLNLNFSETFDLGDFPITINPQPHHDFMDIAELEEFSFLDNDDYPQKSPYDYSDLESEDFRLLLHDYEFWKLLANMIQKEAAEELIKLFSRLVDAIEHDC